MSKHTKEPWLARETLAGDYIIMDVGGAHIGAVYTFDNEPDNGSEVWGNLALVLAAPDLLKACNVALERLREFEFISLNSPNTIPALEAAIAKAEGKTP